MTTISTASEQATVFPTVPTPTPQEVLPPTNCISQTISIEDTQSEGHQSVIETANPSDNEVVYMFSLKGSTLVLLKRILTIFAGLMLALLVMYFFGMGPFAKD